MLLYTHPLSANAHKVALLLGYLGREWSARDVDIPAGEQHEAPFLAISPLGQIPVLDDGDVRLRDSQAILIYFAGRYDPDRTWWPLDALAQGQIAQWLVFAALEQQNGINRARLYHRLGVACDLPAARTQGEWSLTMLEQQLSDRDWLETGRPTIADCACAPFAARAGEAGHDLGRYPAIVAWLDRLRALPGFTGMEGFA